MGIIDTAAIADQRISTTPFKYLSMTISVIIQNPEIIRNAIDNKLNPLKWTVLERATTMLKEMNTATVRGSATTKNQSSEPEKISNRNSINNIEIIIPVTIM